MNKKAGTFQLWVEIILFIILFVTVVGIIGADMNTTYGQNHDLTMGLNLTTENSALTQYKSDMRNTTQEGQTSMTDYGILKLLTAPAILVQITTILWNFVSGGFIYHLVNAMNLGVYGSYIAGLFQILYVIALGFIFLKLVLRVNV